jgi:hypothetical protein
LSADSIERASDNVARHPATSDLNLYVELFVREFGVPLKRAQKDDRPIVPPGKLTAVAVRNATKPGLYGDGLGLYLQVSAFGTRS